MLRQLMVESFNVEELRNLCADLHIHYDEFNQRRASFVTELIEHCERRSRLPELIDKCREERPNINWPISFLFLLSSHEPHFTGRDLQLLHEALQEKNVVIVKGIAGVGKTQYAVEYAHQYKEQYPGGIFQIKANESLQQGVAGLGTRFQPSTVSQPIQDQIKVALEYLQSRNRALLIVDDLSDLSDLASSIEANPTLLQLPCKLLVTTENPQTEPYRSITLTKLSIEHAAQLFLKHLGLQEVDEGSPVYIEVVRICRLLGRLPLAIRLIATSLSKNPDMAASPQPVLTRYRLDLQSHGPVLSRDISKVLASQWEALLSDHARSLLLIIGQLRPISIPIVQLQLLAGLPEQAFQEALAEAKEASLLEDTMLGRVELLPLVHKYVEAQLATPIVRQAFCALLEENVIASLRDSQDFIPTYSKKVIAASECLFNLSWQANRLRTAVLETLFHLIENHAFLGPDLRKAAILLMRVHWLENDQQMLPDKLLTFLEPIVKLANSPVDRLSLIRDIDDLLTHHIVPRHRIQFLIYRALLSAQLYEFLRPQVKQSKDGQYLIREAQKTIRTARIQLNQLADHQPQDSKLKAQICQFAANIAGLMAEVAGNRHAQTRINPINLKMYLNASEAAQAYGQDAMLASRIYAELANNYALSGEADQAKMYFQKALDKLETSQEKITDQESYMNHRGHVLIKAGYVHWEKGQHLAANGQLSEAHIEYRQAYDLTQEAIPLLQGFPSGLRNLAIAYLNGGDYLWDLQDVSLLEEARLYWQKAMEVAYRQGYWDIVQEVETRVILES